MYRKVGVKERTDAYALKGNICYTKKPDQMETAADAYVVCENGLCAGVFDSLPEKYEGLKVMDFGNRLIIPGLVDLHVHAPQYSFRGLGMDLELLDWLTEKAFPEELKYADTEYAKNAYRVFADDLARSATTRACVFATVHRDASEILMDLMEESGLLSYVGKVSMDRNAPEGLLETTDRSLEEIEKWLSDIKDKYTRTRPILTPRFVPTCSDNLLKGLGRLREKYDLPVQSHLSENKDEIEWVRSLCPWSEFYGDVYDGFGLFGGDAKTVMAHCVWSDEAEIGRIKERGVYIAHCPESNMNLSSGIAPVRKYLDFGIRMGLGSDVAGGSSPSVFRAIREAVQVSKMYRRLIDQDCRPVSFPEAFYMGTKGGGSFFGKVGSFEQGYEFDALVLNDEKLRHSGALSISERIERAVYLEDEPELTAKFVAGRRVI